MDMDNLLGGGGGGAAGQFPLEQWFYEMPVCTRWWTAATVATSLLVQCHIITPFQLFYSFRAVFIKNQVSRCLKISSPLPPLVSPNTLSLTFALQQVLASSYYVHLLWPSLTRPPLSRLLFATLLTPSRRI